MCYILKKHCFCFPFLAIVGSEWVTLLHFSLLSMWWIMAVCLQENDSGFKPCLPAGRHWETLRPPFLEPIVDNGVLHISSRFLPTPFPSFSLLVPSDVAVWFGSVMGRGNCPLRWPPLTKMDKSCYYLQILMHPAKTTHPSICWENQFPEWHTIVLLA